MKPNTSYNSPFTNRYASESMRYIWSDHNSLINWRKLWLFLLDCQRELGIDVGVSKEELEEIMSSVDDIDTVDIERIEKVLKHDVVSAMQEFSNKFPEIAEHIHKGATSQFIVDNSDSVCIRYSCMVLLVKAAKVVSILGRLAEENKDLPIVGMTHLQSAQPVTLGKRFAMWASDFASAIESISFDLDRMKIRSIKGTTGSMNSYLEIFGGDSSKVRELEKKIAERMGFTEDKIASICGQTYSRQQDASIASSICLIATAASKMCVDIRLLSSRKELMEGFGEGQVGSSAMPYKRNPISSEKVCSVSRYLISLMDNFYHTASNQWLERSLDDSANRRISLPQLFLSADEILESVIRILEGAYINKEKIEEIMEGELYKFVSESIIIKCTDKGYKREEIHSLLSDIFNESGGDKHIFLGALKEKELMPEEEMDKIFEPFNMTGMCSEQVDLFVGSTIRPIEQHFLGGETC